MLSAYVPCFFYVTVSSHHLACGLGLPNINCISRQEQLHHAPGDGTLSLDIMVMPTHDHANRQLSSARLSTLQS